LLFLGEAADLTLSAENVFTGASEIAFVVVRVSVGRPAAA